MAPLPTIADVYRLAIEWDFPGYKPPVNVWHVRCTDTDDVDAIVAAIGTAYGFLSQNAFGALSSNATTTSMKITPLDGSTAEQTAALGVTIQGNAGGEFIPQVAAVVSFHTAQRGARGRGRMYIGPVGESEVANGFLVSTRAAHMLTGWSEWMTHMRSGSPSVDPVVASYVHADAHSISSHRIDNMCGTQRRRQPR